MDYELMMNGNIKIGQTAPEFNAMTTYGEVNLENYRGKWLVFFSHPGDFTPVCTTEMIAFSRVYNYLKNMNTELLGLSVDSNPSHLAWMYDIYTKTGIIIPFPIVADRSGEIARKYGMISKNVSNTETIRDVVIIDPNGIIKLILTYPMNIGRNIDEIIRCVEALQMADCEKAATPANWVLNDPIIKPMPKTFPMLQEKMQEIEKNKNGINWYLSFKNPNIKCIEN